MTKSDGKQQRNNQPTKGSAKAVGGGISDSNSNGSGNNGNTTAMTMAAAMDGTTATAMEGAMATQRQRWRWTVQRQSNGDNDNGRCDSDGRCDSNDDGRRNINVMVMMAMDSTRATVIDGSRDGVAVATEGAMGMEVQRQWTARWQQRRQWW